MGDRGGLTVDNLTSICDIASKNGKDALLTHTNPKDRLNTFEMLDDISRDTRVGFWMAWAWRDDKHIWVQFFDLLNGDFIITNNCNIGTFLTKIFV
ncbi:hypothetical protein WICPIJ_003491 [Wickerhamomyces pijperi]|uniref:Uncharacterized protein n=1 Tax=Wickerhamomyces pijperi TaxID=599730 RepID=A0A9P8TNT8_WICPI|nr:hypothetical protein WICPIJ_003491 [Wickerhamomyces pijperi]